MGAVYPLLLLGLQCLENPCVLATLATLGYLTTWFVYFNLPNLVFFDRKWAIWPFGALKHPYMSRFTVGSVVFSTSRHFS